MNQAVLDAHLWCRDSESGQPEFGGTHHAPSKSLHRFAIPDRLACGASGNYGQPCTSSAAALTTEVALLVIPDGLRANLTLSIREGLPTNRPVTADSGIVSVMA